MSSFAASYLSDNLDDAGRQPHSDRQQTLGELHRDGLLRGVVFVLMLALPFGLTFGLETLQSAKASLLTLQAHVITASLALKP